jgi:hypothetical protein
VRTALLIVGVLATLMGLLWIGQGLGIVTFLPSPMIGVGVWITRGAVLAVIGLVLILLARRVRR